MNWPIHRARIDDEFVEKKNDDRWNSSTAISLRSKQKYAEWRFFLNEISDCRWMNDQGQC